MLKKTPLFVCFSTVVSNRAETKLFVSAPFLRYFSRRSWSLFTVSGLLFSQVEPVSLTGFLTLITKRQSHSAFRHCGFQRIQNAEFRGVARVRSWGACDPPLVGLLLSRQPTIFRWRKRHDNILAVKAIVEKPTFFKIFFFL